MEVSNKSDEMLRISKQIANLSKDLEKIEKQNIKSINFEEENKKIIADNKTLKTKNSEIIRENNNLKTKNSNLQKRIDRYEEIYSVIPGTTKEDKDRFFKFLAINVLPSVISEAGSSTFKVVERHWNEFRTSKLQQVLSEYITKENYTIMSSILTFFILLKDEDLFFDDLAGIITRICNNTNEIYFDISKLKLENVFKKNNKLSSEITEEVIVIYNYYREIYNNNGEKVRYPKLVSIVLDEYCDVMLEALKKCD